jgi:flagellar hook-associated protein 1 FlgK
MTSSFMGLETAKRSLLTQTIAMQTMGHNISNANTEGYSRQRVNLSATESLYAPGFSRSSAPGQIGTGVQYDDIVRIRDSYLDTQYRRENQSLGEWQTRQANFDTIEQILNEPSDNGLQSVMNDFWNSWETLNRDPSLLSARVDVVGKATNLVDEFHHIGTSLSTQSADLDNNIGIKVQEANDLIQNIAQINDQINQREAMGDNANDFKDQRDLLVDKLSTIVDITVVDAGQGNYSITAAGVQVVNGVTATQLTTADAANAASGELAGYVKAKGDIQLVTNQLNAMLNTLVTGKITVTLPNGYMPDTNIVAKNDVTLDNGTVIPAGNTIPAGSVITSSVQIEVDGFNGLHELGYGLNPPAQSGTPFFVNDGGPFTIDNIKVNPDIVADTSKIAASGRYEIDSSGVKVPIKGNGEIALGLTSLRDAKFTYPSNLTSLTQGTTDDFFRAMISQLGTMSADASRNQQTQQDVVTAIDIRRQSVSGVSMDEEMTDMIKFQQSYNAAARFMTTVDDMLDRIINQTGLVGR